MREAIGGTWLFMLVIFFVLFFAGYMCLSINYSKAFNVKDKIVNELERNGGINKFNSSRDYAIRNIVEYMEKVGYRTVNTCDSRIFKANDQYSWGCDRTGQCGRVNPNTEYAFCLREVTYEDSYKHRVDNEFFYLSYYQVEVFYNLDLPVIGSMFRLDIKGDTKMLYRIDNKDNKKD